MIKAVFTNIEKTIIANLNNATKSIKIAVAWFTNPALFDLILEKTKNDIDIQIILADDKSNFTNPNIDFQKLINKNTSIRISKYPTLMHHKFCLIDNRLLITGSYNWTLKAEKQNIENVILTNELTVIQSFKEEYSRLIEKTHEIKEILKTDFHVYNNEFDNSVNENMLDLIPNDKEQNLGESIVFYEDDEKTEIDEDIWELYDEAEQLYCRAKYNEAITIAEKIIEREPKFSEVYELLSRINWRQKKYKKQIQFAEKAKLLDNLNYAAYNSLGIGFAEIGNSQKSIENYEICINNDEINYIYYWNRGLSYETLFNDFNVPMSLKSQFNRKSKEDFEKTIEITNKFEKENSNDYRLFEIRGRAKLALDKIASSKQDLERALDLYNNSPKNIKDIHILREIKSSLKQIERIKKY